MKKLILLSVIALTSCGKFKFENKIQGTWKMSEAKAEYMETWFTVPATENAVVITENHLSNPWNTNYYAVKNGIVFNDQVVKIEVKKSKMLWVFQNNDSLKFVR